MNTLETSNSYTRDAFKYKLYSSLDERNNLHGYNYMLSQPLQRRHQDAYFVNDRPGPPQDIREAPRDYYFDMRVNSQEKAVIGPMNTVPNIYNDNVAPYARTFEQPNLLKSWEPFSTTPVNAMKGERVQFIPHTPCEVAPNSDSRLWVADQNPELYERKLILSAKENPYANHYRRQGMMQMTALYMPNNGDYYTKKITTPDDTFCNQLAKNGGVPPATTAF
jgi:hypothetical protein